MIVKMQRLAVVCTASSEDETISTLRELGVMHLDADVRADAPALKDAEASLADAKKALAILDELKKDRECQSDVAAGHSDGIQPSDILAIANEITALDSSRVALEKDIALYTPFGDFNPVDAASLSASGINVRLFSAGSDSAPTGSNGSIVKIISDDIKAKRVFGVVIGDMELAEGVEIVPLPAKSLSAMRSDLEMLIAEIAGKNDKLSFCVAYADRIRDIIREREGVRDYAAAVAGMGNEGGVKWLCGYVPEEKLGTVRDAAKAHGWGIIAREPRDDEEPPTLVNPPKLFKPIMALFDILGILPGYREADVSVIFYSFFTIFFAMLVGDAGYGILMLIAAILLKAKFNKAPSAPFALMTVFSFATIIWGVLTATYFGIPQDVLPQCLKIKTAEWLGNQSNIMQFCFVLGATHLSIARIWNACSVFPSRKFLAEVGWLGIIWTMYCAACLVVVDNFVFPKFMFAIAGISTVLIACFMLDKSELKTRGAELGMLPLNIISGLGDIISYVRLYAVGLSSVMVAQNFNTMAFDFKLPLAAKIPCVLLILLLGHGMNLAMGALSILVHAVRLNTLEFSNHKGITWSGYDYKPFRKR